MNISGLDADRHIKLLLIAGLFAFTLYTFYPGSYAVPDSWDQYKEMTTGHYLDWYDGGMAFTWHVLWKITGSYKSLYFFYMILYWALFLFLVWRISLRSPFFWVLLLLAIFFCFIPQYVMRDTLLALFWGWAAALIWRALEKKSWRMAAAALVILTYGLWARLNAMVALLPLIWASVSLIGRKPFALWKHLLITFCSWTFMLSVVLVLTYKMLHAQRAYPGYKLKLLDISGISHLTGADLFPSCIRDYPGYNYDTIRANYTPACFDEIYWPSGNRPSVIPFPNAALDSCLRHSWTTAITGHPLFYLRNRFSGYLYYLRIRRRLMDSEYYNTAIGIDPNNPLHLQQNANKVRSVFGNFYNSLGPTFFFSPWFWLLLNGYAFVRFFLNYRRRGGQYWQIHSCIQLSGLLYILSQFPIYQSDRDFRLCYWNVLVALIALAAFSAWKEDPRRGV